MKIIIVSDIHGAYYDFLSVLESEKFDQLIVLGDIMPYGFYDNNDENDLLDLLTKYKDKLILIEGNCDHYVNYDSYNLKPIKVITMHLNNKLVTLSHGHIYNKDYLPEYHGNIIICGHTHIPVLEKEKNIIYANPGSIGLPRGGSNKSYLVFDNNKLILKTIDNKIIKELNV